MERIAYPPEEQALVLYRVNGISDNTFSEICRDGLDSPLRQSMEGSVSKALPEDQLSPTSWSYLEVSPALELYRWSTAPRAMVRFDRAIPAGNYDLHVVGYRADRPDSSNSVGFELQALAKSGRRVYRRAAFTCASEFLCAKEDSGPSSLSSIRFGRRVEGGRWGFCSTARGWFRSLRTETRETRAALASRSPEVTLGSRSGLQVQVDDPGFGQ